MYCIIPSVASLTSLISICILYLSFVKSFRTPFVLNKLSKNKEISPLSIKCLNFSFASLDSVCSQIVMDPSDNRSMVECVLWTIISSDSEIPRIIALYTLSLPSTYVIFTSSCLTVVLEADISKDNVIYVVEYMLWCNKFCCKWYFLS